MIATDEKFLQYNLDKKIPVPPENEKKFFNIKKIEQIFTAVGGAVTSYAAAKSLNHGSNKDKNLLHYSMVIIGGALALRGIKIAFPSKQDKNEANKLSTENLGH